MAVAQLKPPREAIMAKGQRKSNKEIRKPKKDAGKKKGGAGLGPKS